MATGIEVIEVIREGPRGVQGVVGPEGPVGSLAPLVDFSASSGRYGIASGTLITDTTRAARIEGDGKTQPDGSTAIYQARTNLIPNGGFEVDTAYWQGVYATLITDTTRAKFGAKSCKVTVTTTGQTVIVRTSAAIIAPIAAGVYSFACWLWAEDNVVGKTVNTYLYESGGAAAAGIVGGLLSSQVLASGWNLLTVMAETTRSDRTEISCRFQMTGLVAGDVFWVDGAICSRSGHVLPYVETTGVSDPYAPSPNLMPNGDFETNTTGWSAGIGTIAQDTLHPRIGTKSLKLTANGSGNAYAAHLTWLTGAPVAQVAHAVGGWVWAEGAVVGKTAQFSLTEAGGSQTTAAIANASKTLEAGWNYILVYGTPAQPDRTSLRIYVYLVGAVNGDVLWIDDVRAGANYVAPGVPIVTRSAGRLRLAPSRLRPQQGWIALRVRPSWNAAPIGDYDRRPTLPITLWRWSEDASNVMRLLFDGGYLVFERQGLDGKDQASTPWCPVKGSESLLVAAWTPSGVLVSADGRGLSGAVQLITSDSFDRADGALGSTPQGFAWIASGASAPRIVGGRMEPHASTTGNGYAYLDLGEIPYLWGGVVSYTGTHANLNTTLSYENPAAASLFDLMHMLFHRTGWRHQNRFNGGAFYNGVAHSYSAGPIPSDGSTRTQLIAVDGDTVMVEEPGGSRFAVKHPDIPSLLFPRIFFEVHRADGSQISRWESITVQRKTSTPNGSGNIPFLQATTLIDLGSAGSSGHLNGDILWYAGGRDLMTSAKVTSLNALGNTPLDSQVIGIMPDATQLWTADDL
jgi:hypothetical protein